MRQIHIRQNQDGIEVFSDGLTMFAAPLDLSGDLLIDLFQFIEFLEDVTGEEVELEVEDDE